MKNLSDYRYAHSPAEAVALLRAGPGRGLYVAGGTDLWLAMPPGIDYVVDINGAGLAALERTAADDLRLGATATLQRIATSPLCARYAGGAVADAARACANRQVRTTATLGGNLCNALPAADMAPILLALDARIRLGDGEREETRPLDDFFTGPRRTILDGRLLLAVELPAQWGAARACARKLTRTAEDMALVHVAVALELDGPLIRAARIALGAVAPIPCRATVAEDALVGLKVTAANAPSAIAAAAQLAAMRAEPIDDHRASAAYRRAMVAVLVKRLVRELTGLPSLDGERP